MTRVLVVAASHQKKKRMPNSKKFVMSYETLPYIRQITKNFVILRNERSAKKKEHGRK